MKEVIYDLDLLVHSQRALRKIRKESLKWKRNEVCVGEEVLEKEVDFWDLSNVSAMVRMDTGTKHTVEGPPMFIMTIAVDLSLQFTHSRMFGLSTNLLD